MIIYDYYLVAGHLVSLVVLIVSLHAWIDIVWIRDSNIGFALNLSLSFIRNFLH